MSERLRRDGSPDAASPDPEHASGEQSPTHLAGLTTAGVLALQRSAGNRATAELVGPRAQSATGRRLQRLDTTVHPKLGIGAEPSNVRISALAWATALTPVGPSDPAFHQLSLESDVQRVTLAEDVTRGHVDFSIAFHWEIFNLLIDDHGLGVWRASVPYSVADNQVTFGSALVRRNDVNGWGGLFEVEVSSDTSPGGGSVTATASLTTSTSMTVGGSADVNAEYGGIGGGIGGSVETETPASSGFTRSFRIDLHLPHPEPVIGPRARFQIGSARLEDGQEAALATWFQELPESTKGAIRAGRRAIDISGYASTTAPQRRNGELSEQRALEVERILRGLAGSDARIRSFYLGENATNGPDEREDPAFRCATVQVTAPETTASPLSPAAP